LKSFCGIAHAEALLKLKGRNVVERSFALLKQWRALATRYDKLAITYRAAVVLSACITWLRHIGDTP
jgi:transposase